ncbi:hypothetical protein HOG98_04780 [bacterium]|jgi:hypothetical protein|nr:hypothetical protein [bacterium]
MKSINKKNIPIVSKSKNKFNGFNLLELLLFLFLFSVFLPFIVNVYLNISSSISDVTKKISNSFEIAHINQTIEKDSINCEGAIEVTPSKYQLSLKNNKIITYELKNSRIKRTETTYGYYISHDIKIDSFSLSSITKNNHHFLKLTINENSPSYFKVNT